MMIINLYWISILYRIKIIMFNSKIDNPTMNSVLFLLLGLNNNTFGIDFNFIDLIISPVLVSHNLIYLSYPQLKIVHPID